MHDLLLLAPWWVMILCPQKTTNALNSNLLCQHNRFEYFTVWASLRKKPLSPNYEVPLLCSHCTTVALNHSLNLLHAVIQT